MARLALLGTDTDVGKSFVAAALLVALRARGVAVVPFKPLASGGERADGDAGLLWRAIDHALPIEAITPWQFAPAVAPAFALRTLGERITPTDLLAAARRAESYGTGLVVETAGGLDSPLTDTLTSLDLAELCCGPLLLVAANRLGGLAAVAAALARLEPVRHRLLGVVLNDGAAALGAGNDALQDDNERWLRARFPDVHWTRLTRGGSLPTPLVDRIARQLGGASRS